MLNNSFLSRWMVALRPQFIVPLCASMYLADREAKSDVRSVVGNKRSLVSLSPSRASAITFTNMLALPLLVPTFNAERHIGFQNKLIKFSVCLYLKSKLCADSVAATESVLNLIALKKLRTNNFSFTFIP